MQGVSFMRDHTPLRFRIEKVVFQILVAGWGKSSRLWRDQSLRARGAILCKGIASGVWLCVNYNALLASSGFVWNAFA
jgi:hypothetical protein